MSATRAASPLDRLPRDARWLAPIVAIELVALIGYFAGTPATLVRVRYAIYPFVWMNVGLWAVVRTSYAPAGRRRRLVAGSVAAAYFLALAALAGLIVVYAAGHGHGHADVRGLQVTLSAPGWGPRIAYATDAFHAYFVPYRVVGYLALAYLLYARLLDVSAAALSGVVGLVSCVSCSFPALAALAAGVTGSGLTGAVAGLSVDASTAAFVLAVALLSWRPDAPGGEPEH